MAGISISAPLHALLLAFSSCSPLHSTKLFAHYDYLTFFIHALFNLLHFLARIIYARADFRLVRCFSAFVRSFLFSFLMISRGLPFLLLPFHPGYSLTGRMLKRESPSQPFAVFPLLFFITSLQLLPFLICVYSSYWL